MKIDNITYIGVYSTAAVIMGMLRDPVAMDRWKRMAYEDITQELRIMEHERRKNYGLENVEQYL